MSKNDEILRVTKRPHRIAYKPHPDDFAYKVSRGHLKTLTDNSRAYDLNFTISD